MRLCLSPQNSESEVLLWQGSQLIVKTVSAAHLIASKLIRYDEIDRSDIQFLRAQSNATYEEIVEAVKQLPPPFNREPLVNENLGNLKTDIQQWSADDRSRETSI